MNKVPPASERLATSQCSLLPSMGGGREHRHMQDLEGKRAPYGDPVGPGPDVDPGSLVPQ